MREAVEVLVDWAWAAAQSNHSSSVWLNQHGIGHVVYIGRVKQVFFTFPARKLGLTRFFFKADCSESNGKP
jgi:hypothetical protein